MKEIKPLMPCECVTGFNERKLEISVRFYHRCRLFSTVFVAQSAALRRARAQRPRGVVAAFAGRPVMDYDKPRGGAGGGELTEMERQALDLYVITPRALPGVMRIIDMQNKMDALTAFHEKGSVVEPFEDAISGGPFGNQHGFTCKEPVLKPSWLPPWLAPPWPAGSPKAPLCASPGLRLAPNLGQPWPIGRLGDSGRP